MAHGFMQSFDKNLIVRSAGTEPAVRVNPTAVKVMQESGIDISHHIPKMVDQYIHEEWDFVITVCDHANETCPLFTGNVKNRLHMGFEDPSHARGTDEFILSEFHRVRDEIRNAFYILYIEQIKPIL
jgi:arsenate reductase